MYRLESLAAETWLIRDDRQKEVFRGTLGACEAWLDMRENQPPSANQAVETTFRLEDWVRSTAGQAVNTPTRAETGTSRPRTS